MATSPRQINPEDWVPVGIDELEANALDVVRAVACRSVIAGPGAGKTELLAQRAAYLLQTGVTRHPRRILAISFKRDAAKNLASRVHQRCHRIHAARLDSMTFDAFAKGLLDRFGQTLPDRWRPTPDYRIIPSEDTRNIYRVFLERQVGSPPRSVGTVGDVQGLDTRRFDRDHVLRGRLPVEGWVSPTPGRWAADRFWQAALHGGVRSALTFPMIGRLCELLIRLTPLARDALRLTYSHLFMDEFQDTTQVQYDLVRTIFGASETVVTAVGDGKQQIMRWALAMDDPFVAFERDFAAERTPLLNNYRSGPELVRIQHVLARALDGGAEAPVSKVDPTIHGDSCAIWDFSTPRAEARHLARTVAGEIRSRALAPRDFVLLVRQKPDDYVKVIGPAFAAEGLVLRNEAGRVGGVVLQELLTEDVSRFLISMLRLAMVPHAGRRWTECQAVLAELRGVTVDGLGAQARMTRDLDAHALRLRTGHPQPPATKEVARAVVDEALAIVGAERLMAMHPAYGQGDWLETVLDAAAEHLLTSSQGSGAWTSALDVYEGVDAVPLMTIHRSKGLEYHSVFFVGLDDGAWWSFDRDQIEATAGFFVAFTRAKQRVVFTYSPVRGNRDKIATLYDLLREAGVTRVKIP